MNLRKNWDFCENHPPTRHIKVHIQNSPVQNHYNYMQNFDIAELTFQDKNSICLRSHITIYFRNSGSKSAINNQF